MSKTYTGDTSNVDLGYLSHLLDQIKCKNNGIKSHLQKKDFKIIGMIVGESHLSFEYLREKSIAIDMILDTIKKDVLTNQKYIEYLATKS